MNCFFCSYPITTSKVHLTGFPSLKIGDCPSCVVGDIITTTTVSEDDRIISAHLYVNWKDKRYHFCLHIKENYFIINDVLSKYEKEEIYRSSNVPDININNVLNKLSTYLVLL